MNTKVLLLGATASIALTGAAQAGTAKDWYVGFEGGVTWTDDVDATAVLATSLSTVTLTGPVGWEQGWAFLATVGYAFDNNVRIEGELGYRVDNDTTSGSMSVDDWTLMVNALYDISLSPNHELTLGAGIGYDQSTLEIAGLVDDTDGGLAYQGIAGFSYTMNESMRLTLTYRYLVTSEPDYSITAGPLIANVNFEDTSKHLVSVGIRYDLSPSE